ncbi:MAG: hypothetical protein M0Z95_20115 [Actinomycetota bacterium]|nr:hypothetical protein [Actinomycetota bacterium]
MAIEMSVLRSEWDGDDFVAHRAAVSGVSERTIQMYLRIGEYVGNKVQETLRKYGLSDNLVGLYALAGLPEQAQLQAISLVVSGERGNLQSAANWMAGKQPRSRKPRDPESGVAGVRMLVADPSGVTPPAGGQRSMPVISRVAWTSPALLFLWTSDLVTGLRTASKWGFRVVDSMAWLADACELRSHPGGLVVPRHRTLLVCAEGATPPPRFTPPSVVGPRRDPFEASVKLMDMMWPDWSPADRLRPSDTGVGRPRTA